MEAMDKKNIKYLLVFSLIFCLKSNNLLSFESLDDISEEPKVRIKILNNKKKIVISGLDLTRNFLLTRKVKNFTGSRTLKYQCSKIKLSKDFENKKSVKLANINSHSGIIRLYKNFYYGSLSIIKTKKRNSCSIVNELPLEVYISQVLPKEMSNAWPIEALKAQAVAARSYAIYKLLHKTVKKKLGHEAFYDLENSEKFQVSGTLFDETQKTKEASKKTKGQILVDNDGNPRNIFFHSKCGGKTLRTEHVWDDSIVGYTRVDCPYCYNQGVSSWSYILSFKEMKKVIRKTIMNQKGENYQKIKRILKVEKKLSIILVPDNSENTNLRIYINNEAFVFKKSNLRRYLGRKKIKSNNFILDKKDKNFKISGDGKGHGVGMCQFGVFQMAKMGHDYKQILKFYFPNFKIKTLY
jgi:stage II sporulation protein D